MLKNFCLWVLANMLGGAVSVVLGVVLGMSTAVCGAPGFGGAIGYGVGLAQWWVLKNCILKTRAMPRPLSAGGWVVPSIVGGILPGMLAFFAAFLMTFYGGAVKSPSFIAFVEEMTQWAALLGAVSGAICGAVVGGFHWRILKRAFPHLDNRYGALWVVATALGWAGSWAVQGAGGVMSYASLSLPRPLGRLFLMRGLAGLAACWAINGILTGWVLLRKLRPAFQLDPGGA